MAFELFCMGLITLLFGAALVFLGYRMLWIILPIWGFLFGFGLGAQTLQALFGIGFLSVVASWVVGFLVGALFAVLSYMFYMVAVALLAGSFGYAVAVGLLTAIGLDFGVLVWLIGIVAAIALAAAVLYFNIQKYAVIGITALGGAGVIVFTFLAAFGQLSLAELMLAPVLMAIQDSFWWFLFYVFVAGTGVFVQLVANKNFEADMYNRMAT